MMASDASTLTDSERVLWQSFNDKTNESARETLFVKYLPYAKALAAQLYKRRTCHDVEFIEYHQLASVGLLEAIDHFDVSRNTLFTTFCTPRIRGSILSGLGSISDARAQGALSHRLQKERIASLATPSVSRDRLPVAFAAMCELAAGMAIGFMLEDTGMYSDPENVAVTGCSGYRTIEWKQTQDRLAAAIGRLSERERKVITLHYFHGLLFEQVANVLGLTKGRISQLHRSALVQLRETLQPAEQLAWTG